VLTRLANDPGAIARIARKALEVCHYTSRSGAWTGFRDLEDQDHACEAGCYRCLLSYYNQPDHPQIDRRDESMLDLLCRLTRGQRKSLTISIRAGDSFDELMNISTSSLEKQWLNYLKENGYHLPDRGQPYLEEFDVRPDFAYTRHQLVVYIDGPHHEGQAQKALDAEGQQRLEDAGFTVVRFTTELSAWPRITGQYAWVFGPGGSPAAD